MWVSPIFSPGDEAGTYGSSDTDMKDSECNFLEMWQNELTMLIIDHCESFYVFHEIRTQSTLPEYIKENHIVQYVSVYQCSQPAIFPINFTQVSLLSVDPS